MTEPNRLAWLCLVCGNMTPRCIETKPEQIGYCPSCHGEFEAVEIGKDDARIAEVRERTYPIRVEVDYWRYEQHGVRYQTGTRRFDVPSASSLQTLAFRLADELRPDQHHGIKRVKVVNG